MRIHFNLSKLLSLMLLALMISQIAYVGLTQALTPIPIGKTGLQKAPYESNPTAYTTSGIPAPTTPTNAYDKSLDTYAQFRYTGVATGYFELNTFNTTARQFTTISWVDFKISYKAGNSTDDEYRIVYYVGGSGPVVLQDWVGGSASRFRRDKVEQAHRAWSNQLEPTNGAWDWTDISNVKVRFEVRQVSTADAAQYITAYEVWLSVYTASLPPDGVSVQPSSITDNLNASQIFFIDLYVAGVTNLWGFEFKLAYDTNVLTALDINLGHEYFGYNPLNDKLTGEIRDDLGYVSLVYRSFFGDSVGFTGNTSAVRLYFSVDMKGESSFHFEKAILSNTGGSQIIKPVADGYFRNTAPGNIPSAKFTYSPPNPLQGQVITFDASASTPGAGSINKYKWIFGDTIDLIPNGTGTYTAWTGNHTYWDDPIDVANDGDTSYVSATSGAINESSTLTNLPSLVHSHTITKVRLTIVARNPITSDEKVRLMLVVNGKGYYGNSYELNPNGDTPDYSKYTSDWTTNPATASAWTWSAIDALEAGVNSMESGVWTGEIRVTQLYVSVSTYLEVTGAPPNPVTTYFYGSRGTYSAILGVYNTVGAVGTNTTDIIIRGHDVSTTNVGQYSYRLLRPDSLGTYDYWAGNYTHWDDSPNPDGDTTYVSTRPNVVLKPNGDQGWAKASNWTSVSITPDGNGLYTAWGNDSAYWDDWPTPDDDATYVRATANNLNETSTLTDPPVGIRAYTIKSVRVTVVARNNISGSDEKLQPMLVVQNKGYYGTVSISVSNAYIVYTSDWHKNPNGTAWAWSHIDALQAGVHSVMTGSWTGELRVTQLYVSISTSGDYTQWDDWVNPDDDTTYLSVTANLKDETSAMEDHTSQSWPIQKVVATFRARNTLGTSDERFKPFLLKTSTGAINTPSSYFQPTTNYIDYAYEYATNPFTGTAWTWTDLDGIELGVRSQVSSSWTGEIRVTQIYLTVIAELETSNLQDPTTEAWDINRIRVTAVARNTTASDEQMYIGIYVGGTLYFSDPISTNTTYVAYSWEWITNPQTVAPWLWYDITYLEAGVKSRQIGREWTGEIRVTQLYVEVFGNSPPTSNLIEVSPGEYIRFTVGVQNHGSFNEANVNSILYVGSTQIGVQTLSINTGITTTYVYTWLVSEVANGTHTVSVTSSVANEYHTEDNTFGDGRVKVRPYHDVAVTAVIKGSSLVWTRAFQGYQRSVTVTVKNQGSTGETFTVAAYYYNASKTFTLGTPQVVTLIPGEVRNVTFTTYWNTAGVKYGFFTVKGNASVVAGETDMADNSKEAAGTVMLTIPGDANGDRSVNSLDIGALNGHWAPSGGAPPWSLGYSLDFDPNADGYINSLDIGVVNANWGKTW